MKTLHIAQHELRRIFVSPLAWAVLAVVQLILGLVFVMTLVDFSQNPPMMDEPPGVSEIVGGSLFGFSAIVLLLVMPLMTMRLFSEERRSGTLDLLLSAPASLTEIVLGKYLGVLGFAVVMVALIGFMPLSLLPMTPLDLGRIAAGLLGLFLVMAAFGAAGLFMSSLTDQPTVAAVSSLGLLLLLWLVHWIGFQDFKFSAVFHYLSLIGHYDSMLRGVFETSDVIYYLLVIGFFLGLTVQRLDMERH
jgi:ABC-2 type transport system permease protein